MFSLGLIINTHEQPEYLARVLGAVSRQISPPAEVLLADDGSGEAVRAVFARWAATQPRRAEHVWQSHEGFRRARILNQAIARAQSEYLVFLDGDTLPHPQFIADHRRLARQGVFIQGHRALVKEQAAAWFGLKEFTEDRRRAFWRGQLEGVKHAFRWPFPMLRTRGDLRGIRGCNLGLWRDDLLRVNGYNEAFVGWGREDSELAVRLLNSGVRRLDARGWAVCCHLWHPPASRAAVPDNDELLAAAIKEHAVRCARGVQQHLSGATALPGATTTKDEPKFYAGQRHITPVPFFYLAHALLDNGFTDIGARADRIQRSSALWARLLQPLLRFSQARNLRRRRRRYFWLPDQIESLAQVHNSWTVLTGRTLIVSARKGKQLES